MVYNHSLQIESVDLRQIVVLVALSRGSVSAEMTLLVNISVISPYASPRAIVCRSKEYFWHIFSRGMVALVLV